MLEARHAVAMELPADGLWAERLRDGRAQSVVGGHEERAQQAARLGASSVSSDELHPPGERQTVEEQLQAERASRRLAEQRLAVAEAKARAKAEAAQEAKVQAAQAAERSRGDLASQMAAAAAAADAARPPPTFTTPATTVHQPRLAIGGASSCRAGSYTEATAFMAETPQPMRWTSARAEAPDRRAAPTPAEATAAADAEWAAAERAAAERAAAERAAAERAAAFESAEGSAVRPLGGQTPAQLHLVTNGPAADSSCGSTAPSAFTHDRSMAARSARGPEATSTPTQQANISLGFGEAVASALGRHHAREDAERVARRQASVVGAAAADAEDAGGDARVITTAASAAPSDIARPSGHGHEEEDARGHGPGARGQGHEEEGAGGQGPGATGHRHEEEGARAALTDPPAGLALTGEGQLQLSALQKQLHASRTEAASLRQKLRMAEATAERSAKQARLDDQQRKTRPYLPPQLHPCLTVPYCTFASPYPTLSECQAGSPRRTGQGQADVHHLTAVSLGTR